VPDRDLDDDVGSGRRGGPVAHDVFVSYSHHDKPEADAVCATLEANRIRCWIAPRDITPGQEWGAAIVDAIQSSRVMVLVFSSHANASPQIRREVQLAVDAETVLIPFRIEDVAPTQSLKYYLGTPHWLDALTSPLEAHLERLAAAATSFLAVSEPVGSSAGSATTPQSGLGTDTDPTAPPSTRGGEHRIEQRIPAPESAAANEKTTRESHADRLPTTNIASTPGQSDALKIGPTRDRLAAAVLPTDTSTGKARLFERLSRRAKIALATGIVVSVVAIVVGVVVKSTGPSSQSTSSTPTFTDTPDSTPTSTDRPPADPEVAALEQLQVLKAQDAPAIDQVVGRWIPQLSSKHGTKPWTTDSEANVVYDPVHILQEYQRLSQKIGAKLLWSGDWTTFDQPDEWVTVVATAFSDSASVLNWCRSVYRDADHCDAQIVSKTLGVNGTHAN
jgi:hypothetical protein